MAKSDEGCSRCSLIALPQVDRIVLADEKYGLALIDGSSLAAIDDDSDLGHLAMAVPSPDGSFVVGVGSELVLWQSPSLTRRMTRGPYDQPFTAAAWSPDSERFAVAHDGRIEVWTRPTLRATWHKAEEIMAGKDLWLAMDDTSIEVHRFDGSGTPCASSCPAPAMTCETSRRMAAAPWWS